MRSTCLLFAALLSACASGGGLTSGHVDLRRLSVEPPLHARPRPEAVHLMVEPIPERVSVEIHELLPDQVASLRAPRVLGRVEVEGVRAALTSGVIRVVGATFAKGEARDGQLAVLRFHDLRIELDVAQPPRLELDVSTCDRTNDRSGASNASDRMSESTTTFGPIPEADQRAFVHLSAELELTRELASAEQTTTRIEQVSIAGSSDGFPLATADVDAMFAQALRRAFVRLDDHLPVALARLGEPGKSVEELLRELCAERKASEEKR